MKFYTFSRKYSGKYDWQSKTSGYNNITTTSLAMVGDAN